VVCSRKNPANSSWKKTCVAAGLEGIHLYRSEDNTKLRTSITLKSIIELDSITNSEMLDMPHPFGVKVTYGATAEQATFSFASKEEADHWMEELNWRVQASLRVYKYDDDDGNSSEESSKGTKDRKKKPTSKSSGKRGFSLTKKKDDK